MKLENKFFRAFFFPFLISIILSSLVIIAFLGIFTFNKYDKRVIEKIISLEKNYSKLIINSADILIKNMFLKFQVSLNEQIVFYQNKAKELLLSEEEQELNDKYLKCLLTFDSYVMCFYYPDDVSIMSFWMSDGYTSDGNLDKHKDVKRQLIAYSNIIPNLNAIYETEFPKAYEYFFYFEETELYISFPIVNNCNNYFIFYMIYPYSVVEGCNRENGEPYEVYKIKCQIYYKNMMKSKTNIFDKNNLSQNKTIFINNFYSDEMYNYELTEKEFTMCIQFDDPITKGKGYACVYTVYTNLIDSLEELNLKVPGFFFLTNVGFSNLLYFPREVITPKTSTEQIYNWDVDFILSEKLFFRDNIDVILTSNYIDYIGQNIYDEIYINGKNSSEQVFYLNEIKFKYSIYPIVFINVNGKREHVMSLIYAYNEQLYLDKLENYDNTKIKMIIIEIIIFIVFGYSLLYLINLTFDTLAKYITIPVKNINYMLKGINIGGKNRLKYLEFLKKKTR